MLRNGFLVHWWMHPENVPAGREAGHLLRHLDQARRPRNHQAAPSLLTGKKMLSVFHGDCLEVMRALKDQSVDAVITDSLWAGVHGQGMGWCRRVPQEPQ